MGNLNVKAFEFAMEITVAAINRSDFSINRDGGERTAEFLETVYNKLVELDEEAAQELASSTNEIPAAEEKD